MDFNINEALKSYLNDPKSIPTPDASPELGDVEGDGDNITSEVLLEVLEPIRDSIHENPDALARSATFDTLQCLLKYAEPLQAGRIWYEC